MSKYNGVCSNTCSLLAKQWFDQYFVQLFLHNAGECSSIFCPGLLQPSGSCSPAGQKKHNKCIFFYATCVQKKGVVQNVCLKKCSQLFSKAAHGETTVIQFFLAFAVFGKKGKHCCKQKVKIKLRLSTSMNME